MKERIDLPLVTPEMEFVANHEDEVDEVLENESDTRVGELTNMVWMRAVRDADSAFRRLESAVSASLAGVLRLEWVNTNRGENWSSRARIHMPMGPMRRIGSMGLWIGWNDVTLRLFGWVWPRWGGLDGRRELVRRCKPKYPLVCLPYEHPKKYPGFTENEGVVWFDEQLSRRTLSGDVLGILKKRARTFFRLAKPVLKELADG